MKDIMSMVHDAHKMSANEAEVEANKKPLNGEGSFLDCNVEYRYFDTEREARAYLGR